MARLLTLALAGFALGIAGQRLMAKGEIVSPSQLGHLFSENESTGYSGIGATIHGCTIKGNISLNTGERIYHIPGQEHYDETVITPSKGERWFCSESDAQAAGWRRARSYSQNGRRALRDQF
jgi:hypothetical protein